MKKEIWKKVKGFEKYYKISDMGRIKSLHKEEKILKGSKLGNYPGVCLWKNGKKSRNYIHRLVAQHFIPNPKNKLEVNHINGIKNDNRVENLEWVTRSENELHANKLGLNKRNGEDNPMCKYSDIEIIKTIKMYNEGLGINKIARKTGISPMVISRVMRGISRKNLTHLVRKENK